MAQQTKDRERGRKRPGDKGGPIRRKSCQFCKANVVDVADGYGRNFLLPRQLAQKATPGALKDVTRRQELQARHEAASVDQAQKIAGELGKAELRFEVSAGPTGTLFGAVTPSQIAD